MEEWSKVFVSADDIIIDLRLEDEITDSVDCDIAAYLDAGLNRQSTDKNDQTQKDYDVHYEGLKWISFAVPTSDHLIYFANTSVDYIFFRGFEESNRVWIRQI